MVNNNNPTLKDLFDPSIIQAENLIQKAQFKVGPYTLENNVFLAPMAGYTDAVFRGLCAQFGAGLTFSEMITSDTHLWHTRKTQSRLNWHPEETIKAIQLAGTEPEKLLEAANAAIDKGAGWIDINMGCPMKKVCKTYAGSALMASPTLVAKILSALCSKLDVPVTLKTRTGSSASEQNVLEIAKIAEDCGVQMITIHGRHRAQRFTGDAQYEQIAAVKQNVNIPVIVNGDLHSTEKIQSVLNYTKADGVMIGRGSLGRPWLFHELNNRNGAEEIRTEKKMATINTHLEGLYELYGEITGVRTARKHIKWYYLQLLSKDCQSLPDAKQKLQAILKENQAQTQLHTTLNLFKALQSA